MDTGRGRTRVLWLTKGLGPGGAERLLLSFAQKGDHDRFEFHAAYVLPWKDHLAGNLEAAGVTVHCLQGTRPWDPRWLWQLRRLIVRERIDVVHHHSPLVAAQARLILRTIPRRQRPRSITTEHNVWGSHHPVTRLLNQVTIGGDDHVFAVSDQVRDSMAPSVRAQVEVLIHGVDVKAIAARRGERAVARAEHGLTDDDFVVVTVANLRATKDHPTMLRAARLLVKDGVPVTFLSVGQGPLESELHALRDELGLGDRFRFLGYQADPIRVLAAGDVFCLSSRYEGLPIALLEALAMGLPVVATAVGGVPAVVPSSSLAPVGNARRIAELISGERAARPSVPVLGRGPSIDATAAIARQEALYAAPTSPLG